MTKNTFKQHLFTFTLVSVFLQAPAAFAELNLELPQQNQSNSAIHASNFTATATQSDKGIKIIRKLRSQRNLIEDPELINWIQSIGNRLTANASHSSAPFYFVISRNTDFNAYATQGGLVVVNAGLIVNTSSESEIAAVLSHEIAHITQRHINRMLEKAKNNQFIANAAVIAGILASSKNSQAGQAILNTTIATMVHKQLAFTREAEAEADRVGIRILASSGYNPQAMPSLLKKLESYNSSEYANIREFLQNHPLTQKRVTDTQIRANQFKVNKTEPNNFLYMREKVRVLSGSTSTAPGLPGKIKKYTRALQLYKARNYQQALKIIGTHSKQLSEVVLIASTLNKLNRYQESIKLLQATLRNYPDEIELIIPLSQALIATGNAERAWQILKSIETTEQTSLEFFEAKQEAARLTKRTSQAYFAVANRNIKKGNYKAARAQLMQAIKLPGASHFEMQEMQGVLSQINSLLKK